MTTANNQSWDVPESEFRDAYSNLVLAIWGNPFLENQIMANPAKISEYGFKVIPKAIRFESPRDNVSLDDYQTYMTDFTARNEVTLFIPQKPTIQSAIGTESLTHACCTCTPCCSGGHPGPNVD